MNVIEKLFIALLFEQQAGIPRGLTMKVFEALEHSDAMKKLFTKLDEACRSGCREIKQSTIDEAFEEMERLIDIQIESEKVSEHWKLKLKAKNKSDIQMLKNMFCDSLLHDGFIIK